MTTLYKAQDGFTCQSNFIGLLDTKTNQRFTFDKETDAEDFMDKHHAPNRLIATDVMFSDGGGTNGSFSRIAITRSRNRVGHRRFMLELTNIEAEYIALYHCCLAADKDTLIYADCELVVKQVNKEWQVKEKRFDLLQRVIASLIESKNLQVLWCARAFNVAGIYLDHVKSNDKRNDCD